jgi:radical SAM protein with 4Fe4S-binding SPASM domain
MAKMEKMTERLYKIANMPKEYLREDPPLPKSVKIELCSDCNFACSYCAFTTRTEKPQREMDFELFKKIANELKECKIPEVGLFYIGESMLSMNLLFEALSYLKDEMKIPYVFLTSNGSLATPHNTKRLMKRGLDSIKWSVNFSDIKQFSSMTKIKDQVKTDFPGGYTFMDTATKTFEQILKNIQKAWELREENNYPTRLYASSIHYNDEQVEKMQPLLNQFILPYVDEHYWLPLLNEVPQFGNKKTPGNSGIYYKAVDPIPCWTIFTAGHILSDGRFTACCHDAIGKWVMGDLKTQSLKEIWNSQKFKELRKAHLAKKIKGTICEACLEPQYNIKH